MMLHLDYVTLRWGFDVVMLCAYAVVFKLWPGEWVSVLCQNSNVIYGRPLFGAYNAISMSEMSQVLLQCTMFQCKWQASCMILMIILGISNNYSDINYGIITIITIMMIFKIESIIKCLLWSIKQQQLLLVLIIKRRLFYGHNSLDCLCLQCICISTVCITSK